MTMHSDSAANRKPRTSLSSTLGTILRAMGFDPTRKQRRTRFDYWYVAVGLLVCIGLILWAVLG